MRLSAVIVKATVIAVRALAIPEASAGDSAGQLTAGGRLSWRPLSFPTKRAMSPIGT